MLITVEFSGHQLRMNSYVLTPLCVCVVEGLYRHDTSQNPSFLLAVADCAIIK